MYSSSQGERIHAGLRAADLGDHQVAVAEGRTRAIGRVAHAAGGAERNAEDKEATSHVRYRSPASGWHALAVTRELRLTAEIAPERVALVAAASRLGTLEDVLAYGLARQWDVVEVVVQDEYTHDVIIATPHAIVLVFDTT